MNTQTIPVHLTPDQIAALITGDDTTLRMVNRNFDPPLTQADRDRRAALATAKQTLTEALQRGTEEQQ